MTEEKNVSRRLKAMTKAYTRDEIKEGYFPTFLALNPLSGIRPL